MVGVEEIKCGKEKIRTHKQKIKPKKKFKVKLRVNPSFFTAPVKAVIRKTI